MFAVRLIVEVCLDLGDQDHNGVNFCFRIESEACTFITEWQDDQNLDILVDQLEGLVLNRDRCVYTITNSCDGEVCFADVGDFVECSIQLDHFISLESTLNIKNIGIPRDEFIRFVESLRQLVSDRESMYRQYGLIKTNKT